ncbi:MAG: general stress protein [Pseudomonas sp.]
MPTTKKPMTGGKQQSESAKKGTGSNIASGHEKESGAGKKGDDHNHTGNRK